MATYITHRGRVLDMDALRVQQENTLAAGNMQVNANGDKLDRHGNIIEGANKKARKSHKQVTKIKRQSLKPKHTEPVPQLEEAKKEAPKPKTRSAKKTVEKSKEHELEDGSIEIIDAEVKDSED